jgi:L,D-transpeptidase YcbB
MAMGLISMSKWFAGILSPFPLLAILFAAIIFVPTSHAVDFSMAEVQASLKSRLDDKTATGTLVYRGDLICGIEMMPLAYRSRAYMPFWIDASFRLDTAKALIEAIGRAGEDGLLPSDYHLGSIYRLLADMAQERSTNNTVSPERWADLDLILTDAFLLLGTHLLIGRVNPETLHTDWKIDPGRVTLFPFLLQAASTGDIAAALNALRPSHGGYAALRNALASLRQTAATGGWPMFDDHQTLRPGDRSDGVDALRQRLAASGDLDALVQGNDKHFFDATLVTAVRRFQRRHGLKDDGIVGLETVDMLNVPVEKRIRQVEINLERWRWLPHQLGSRYIIVNTAAFNLNAVEAGKSVLTMRVVVGRPARRSPVFSSKIAYLVVNPYWNVPTTIAVEDILPEVQKNVSYLTEQGIRVYQGWQADAPEIDPTTVNWQAYHAGRFPFRLRQDPGPRNALGRIKFMFPNEFAVYLHDTPDHNLFNHVQRDLSSGCIRVEAPIALASFVLAEDDRWTPEALTELVEKGEPSKIRLGHPIPVHLLYMTAWADEGGIAQFRSDIYHQDRDLDQALNQQRPIQPLPEKPTLFLTNH